MFLLRYFYKKTSLSIKNFDYVVGPLRLLAPWDKYLLFNRNLPSPDYPTGRGSLRGLRAPHSDFIIILFKENRNGVALRNIWSSSLVQAFSLSWFYFLYVLLMFLLLNTFLPKRELGKEVAENCLLTPTLRGMTIPVIKSLGHLPSTSFSTSAKSHLFQ